MIPLLKLGSMENKSIDKNERNPLILSLSQLIPCNPLDSIYFQPLLCPLMEVFFSLTRNSFRNQLSAIETKWSILVL